MAILKYDSLSSMPMPLRLNFNAVYQGEILAPVIGLIVFYFGLIIVSFTSIGYTSKGFKLNQPRTGILLELEKNKKITYSAIYSVIYIGISIVVTFLAPLIFDGLYRKTIIPYFITDIYLNYCSVKNIILTLITE